MSIAINCLEYPNWKLVCHLAIPAPTEIEWFVSIISGKDNPSNGTNRSTPFRTIQYAINHLHPQANSAINIINIMGGTYTENITLQDNIVLRRDTNASCIIQNSSPDNPIISCNNVKNIRILNLSFYGTLHPCQGLVINNSQNITIHNCELCQCIYLDIGGGIHINQSQEIMIDACNIHNNFVARCGGIAVSNQSRNITILNSQIENNSAGNILTAISSLNIDYSIIQMELTLFDIVLGNAHGGGIAARNARFNLIA
jgi:pectin methylesterase-like acyl-CoA thioesterase